MVAEIGPRRLLLVVPWALRLDARHGGRVIAQLLLRLAERNHVAVVYMNHPGEREFEPELADRCDLVVPVDTALTGPGMNRWMRRASTLAAPLRNRPLPVAALYSRRLSEACVQVGREWRPDVVQVEHDNLAYCGPPLRDSGTGAARILVCHEPGPLASADQARVARGRRRLAHRLDVGAWHRYWAEMLPSFDAIVALTEADREVIEAAVAQPRVTTIGLGIEIPPEPLDAAGGDDVLFVGGYRHPPNTDAALRLLGSILPRVRRTLPDVKLTLVGSDPGEELRVAAGENDQITGTVPDVAPHLDRAGLFVLPIRLGGGMRVKLLEALAAGKAVVASPLAAAGLEVEAGILRLAESDAEFAEAIVDLLRDDAARRRLGERARAWAIENLSWDARVEQYEALYDSLRHSSDAAPRR